MKAVLDIVLFYLGTRKFTVTSGCSWSNKKISSDSMCLAYTLNIKTSHRGNGALFKFSLNSLQIFQSVVTGFGHKDMK